MALSCAVKSIHCNTHRMEMSMFLLYVFRSPLLLLALLPDNLATQNTKASSTICSKEVFPGLLKDAKITEEPFTKQGKSSFRIHEQHNTDDLGKLNLPSALSASMQI